jgi:hypothetical protein
MLMLSENPEQVLLPPVLNVRPAAIDDKTCPFAKLSLVPLPLSYVVKTGQALWHE